MRYTASNNVFVVASGGLRVIGIWGNVDDANVGIEQWGLGKCSDEVPKLYRSY